MAEFFMGLSTTLGWGVAGVYVALGIVGFGIILGIGLGAYAYKRRRNLKKNRIRVSEKSGQFEITKVKNTTKFHSFLKRQFNELFGNAISTLKEKPSKTEQEQVSTKMQGQAKGEKRKVFMQDKMNTELKSKRAKEESEEVETVKVEKNEKTAEKIEFSEKDGMDLG